MVTYDSDRLPKGRENRGFKFAWVLGGLAVLAVILAVVFGLLMPVPGGSPTQQPTQAGQP